jgi:hypothetical protein
MAAAQSLFASKELAKQTLTLPLLVGVSVVPSQKNGADAGQQTTQSVAPALSQSPQEIWLAVQPVLLCTLMALPSPQATQARTTSRIQSERFTRAPF